MADEEKADTPPPPPPPADEEPKSPFARALKKYYTRNKGALKDYRASRDLLRIRHARGYDEHERALLEARKAAEEALEGLTGESRRRAEREFREKARAMLVAHVAAPRATERHNARVP